MRLLNRDSLLSYIIVLGAIYCLGQIEIPQERIQIRYLINRYLPFLEISSYDERDNDYKDVHYRSGSVQLTGFNSLL
jgi:hypothetical protein